MIATSSTAEDRTISLPAIGMFLTRLEPDGFEARRFTPPALGPREVLVEVSVAGVGFADSLVVSGCYQTARPLPFIPGSEGAGRVVQIGVDVSSVDVGDRVMFAPLAGCFASHVLLRDLEVVVIPECLGDEDAAAMVIPYGTAYHALSLLGRPLDGSDIVLVPGASGSLGLALMSISRRAGARAIGVVSSFAKASRLRARGFDDVVVGYGDALSDRVEALRATGGVTVVADAVGGEFTDRGFRALAWRGDYLVLGFASGDVSSIALNRVLLREARLRGAYWGRLRDEDPAAYGAAISRIARGCEAGEIELLDWESHNMSDAREVISRAGERGDRGKLLLRQDLVR